MHSTRFFCMSTAWCPLCCYTVVLKQRGLFQFACAVAVAIDCLSENSSLMCFFGSASFGRALDVAGFRLYLLLSALLVKCFRVVVGCAEALICVLSRLGLPRSLQCHAAASRCNQATKHSSLHCPNPGSRIMRVPSDKMQQTTNNGTPHVTRHPSPLT